MSDNSIKYIKTIQDLLQRQSSFRNGSDVFDILLRYVISEVDSIPINDLVLIDDYFSKHPAFLNVFLSDVMMSATSYSDYYSS
ncbi:MAG: hypothetical protein ACE5GR_06060 [Nitrosopumilus sp.]